MDDKHNAAGAEMEADVIKQARELAAKEGIELDQALMIMEIEIIKRIESTEQAARWVMGLEVKMRRRV